MGLPALNIEDLPHYTYSDYNQWEGRWEIIRGIPYAMAPSPSRKHQQLSLRIASQLDSLLEACQSKCIVYQAIDWQIMEDTVVQPDVLVVCDENQDGQTLEIPPVLVFEILSPSTQHKDRGLKYRLYQEAGVKYYCIVDPELESIEVFLLRKDEYRKEDEFEAGKISFYIEECPLALDINMIFNRLRST
jgi:Uma2 family endonuclease